MPAGTVDCGLIVAEMRRFGAVLFWLGVVILIAGGVLAYLGGVRAVDAVRSTVDEAGPMPGRTATVQLEQGDRRTIYERTQNDFPSASCEVTGPGGSRQELTRPSETGGALGGTSVIDVGEFEAATAGSYTITCAGGETLLGPSPDLDGLGSGALGVLGGVLGAGLGLLLMLIGAILWFVGRSKDRSPGGQQGPAPYGDGAHGGGYADRPPPPPPSG